MKKPIKLAVSLFICGLILLSGCTTTQKNSLPSELVAKTGDYPKSVNIIAPDFFKTTGAANADQAKQKWLDEISERYGVILKIFSSYNEAKNNSSSASGSVSGQNSNFTGLVSIDSSFILQYGVLKDLYMPLDSYLADNAVWNALPEEFKSLFKVNGHIYAIPTSVLRVQKARIIHDEALAETDISVTDLASFHDFAVSYAKKAGKGSGRGKFTGAYLLSEVTDVLNAFGLYPANDENVQFCYDPTADCYVDWLTKDSAIEALEYLRELFNISALSIANKDEIEQSFLYSVLASKYAQYSDNDNCTVVLTLNSEYPHVLLTEISGFAMTKDTPQPKETINFLVNMLFGSEQNYLDCWLGSSDNYILNSDDTLTIKMTQDSEGNYVLPAMPNLTSGLSDIFPYSDANILYNQNAEKNKARLKILNDSLESGALVEVPSEYQIIKSAAYDKNITDAANSYYICFLESISNPNKTVQEIVDEYKKAMLDLGGNKMLDEMNAAIGKKTAYYYG